MKNRSRTFNLSSLVSSVPNQSPVLYFCLKDQECLQTDGELGDNVVNSYLERFLDNPPAKKILLLKNFFYTKLCLCLEGLADSTSSSIHRFSDLRRWWKERPLFDQSYIIIPISICMPEIVSKAGIPFLHFDSLPGNHNSDLIRKNLESCLNYEWRSVNGTVQTSSSKRRSEIELVQAPRSLPRQPIVIDCGIYVIYTSNLCIVIVLCFLASPFLQIPIHHLEICNETLVKINWIP